MKTKTYIAACALFGLLLGSATAQVTVTSVLTNGLAEPYNVAVDGDSNIYATDSANNRIIRIDRNSQAVTTLAGIPGDAPGSNDGPSYLAHFSNPQGMIHVHLNGVDGLLVTDHANNLIRFVRLSDGNVTTIAGRLSGGPAVNAPGSLAAFLYPVGMDQDDAGNVYIADWGNNTIRVLNLNDPNLGVTNLVVSGTTFFRPTAVAYAGTNSSGARVLWIADTGNQQIKQVTLNGAATGTMTTFLGGYRVTGTTDSAFGPNARFNGPSGLLVSSGSLLVSDTLNNTVRLVTNYPAFGPTNYAVITYAGTAGSAGLVDGSPLAAKFNSPYGMASDFSNNGFLVADLKNNALRRIQIGAPLPPVPAPRIGWVDFPPPDFRSLLMVNQPFIFNNDVIIAIDGTDGAQTHFTYGPTPSNPLDDSIPNPDSTIGSTPPPYRDGVFSSQVAPTILQPQPDVTVKAIGFQPGRQSSPVVSARFQFKVGNPIIQGNNAALFTISEQTAGSELWYTTDGSEPIRGNPSVQVLASQAGISLSLNISSNFTFKARGFRDNYQPSDIVLQNFSATNFNATRISFGFTGGEASSDFIASPGQRFFSPVTLTILPTTKIYSLQFNITVTNAGPNPGPAVTPGAVGFVSFLEKPAPAPPTFRIIPPAMFLGLVTNTVVVTNVVGTNIVVTTNIVTYGGTNPPPASSVFNYGGLPFLDLTFVDTSLNLIGVGWLERAGKTNLYDTTVQDLIKYSQPHDTIFLEDDNRIVCGGYAFQVPGNSSPGQTYQIQIGRPSATSDGIGTPGSDVYISAPTNGSYGAGALNSIKYVTVGQRKYVVGDAAPFRWFNAGDFGNTNLDNSDVMQVFQSAIYSLNYPPLGSDFFDVMDSCGGLYADFGRGYLEYSKPVATPDELNALFDGDDTSINQIAFGDGTLDVCDIYVTFRRSLDPSLTWFRRFWTNGVRAAEIVGNGPPQQPLKKVFAATKPVVNFATTDIRANAGQTLTIPVTAQILGTYPMRVLTLNLSVTPLDGSPNLTSQIQFTPNPALGQPTLTTAQGIGNYAASWLNNNIAGLTGNAVIGTLTVTIPANASANSSYAIHFDHASASPNGLASFDKHTTTGLITLSDRSTSTFGDSIPDSWRLRYFGSINNMLSTANADADGDGASNMQEYVAGTDPMDSKSVLRAASNQGTNHDCVIRWPSVTGKTYIIERSASLFSPNWTPVGTNVGNGSDLEFHDSSAGTRFYRVSVQ